jgi:histidyl-tRNA synthetase
MSHEGEILSLLVSSLKKLINTPFIIKINDKELLIELLKSCGVTLKQIYSATVCLDKLDKKDWDEVMEEMIKEKGICESVVKKIKDTF